MTTKTEQQKTKPRNSISLGVLLVISFAGLQFLSILAVVWHSYVSSERVLLDHARKLLGDLATNAAGHTRSFLDPAKDAAELLSRLMAADPFLVGDWTTLEEMLFQQMRVTPHLAGVYYGDEFGNFLYVMDEGDGERYRTKTITRDSDGRRTSLTWRDPNFTMLSVESDPDDTYDPRKRPWYEGVKEKNGTIWTNPYIFFTAKSPGITVASPVRSQGGRLIGVVGADIQIDQISDFLSELTGGVRGRAFVVNEDGNVIAHPTETVTELDEESGRLGFVNIAELTDPVARAAFSEVDLSDSLPDDETVSFRLEGTDYLAVLESLETLDLPWTIAVYAAEDDFIGGITNSRQTNMMLSVIVALLAAFAGLMIARMVYRPVRELAERAEKLDSGLIEPMTPYLGRFPELQTANAAMEKQSEERKRTEMEYGLTFDRASRGMAQIDPATGRFLRVNATFSGMTGHDGAKLAAMTVSDLSEPGDKEGFARFDWWAVSGEEASRRLRLLTAEGDRLWVEINAILIKDFEGNVVHTVATIDDVSELMQAETQVRKLSNELAHSARLNTMGQVAASLAHELNQPLTAVTQNADAALLTAEEELPREHELFEILSDLGEQAHRAGEIITTLREFIRRDSVIMEPFDLSVLISQTSGLIRPEATAHDVVMSVEADDDLPTLTGNRVQIAQVLVNLMRNGIDAIEQGEGTTRLVRVLADVRPGDVLLAVEDTGIGVADDVSLFTPFETTKASGMGLGLTICRGIVEAHGGQLWHEKGADGETRFCFTLPRVAAASKDKSTTDVAAE